MSENGYFLSLAVKASTTFSFDYKYDTFEYPILRNSYLSSTLHNCAVKLNAIYTFQGCLNDEMNILTHFTIIAY